MEKWIEVEQGYIRVLVTDLVVWRAMLLHLALSGLWYREIVGRTPDGLIPMSMEEFFLVATSCPCEEHQDELAYALYPDESEVESG